MSRKIEKRLKKDLKLIKKELVQEPDVMLAMFRAGIPAKGTRFEAVVNKLNLT